VLSNHQVTKKAVKGGTSAGQVQGCAKQRKVVKKADQVQVKSEDVLSNYQATKKAVKSGARRYK
jgi:hypothetical protein